MISSRFFALALFISLVFAVEVSAQTAQGEEWKKFSSVEGRFTVLMPLEPAREDASQETPAGKVVMHLFTSGIGRGLFIVGYADYPFGESKQELDADRDNFLKGMKATLVSESDIKLRGNPGREILAERDNLRIRSRIYLVGKRYYQLVAITPATLPSDLEADKFLTSFELSTTPLKGTN